MGALLAWLAVGGPIVAQQSAPVFHARTDLVSVNVSVRQGNRPVDGLASQDFRVTDNGVTQSVKTVGSSEVAVDVTFVLSVGWRARANLSQFHKDILHAAEPLHSGDRLRILEFGNNVAEILPLQPPGDRLAEQLTRSFTQTALGWQAVHDALAASLILPVDPNRRQLVVAWTQGLDEASVLSAAKLIAVAQRTEAVLQVLRFGVSPGARPESVLRTIFGDFPFRLGGELDPIGGKEAIARAAEITGGRVFEPGLLARSLADSFKNVLEAYRHSYILHYELVGPSREGWHDVSVQLTRQGRYNIQARKGYFIDAALP
jgi:VWFA-related protein